MSERATTDSERLDWLDKHAASLDVRDDECLGVSLQSSEDYRVHASYRHYDIREVIDAAMAVEASLSTPVEASQ